LIEWKKRRAGAARLEAAKVTRLNVRQLSTIASHAASPLRKLLIGCGSKSRRR
jgi:hypothetical protein